MLRLRGGHGAICKARLEQGTLSAGEYSAIAVETLRALPDAGSAQAMNDLVNYGVYVTKDGERVDPMDFYAEPPK